MRVFQCFLLCIFLHSFSVDAFRVCVNDADCPDNAVCVSTDARSICQCKNGFDEIDLPDITRNSQAATVCIG